MWHPFMQYVPRPNANWTEVEGKNRVVVEINSLGFRSEEIQESKPDGVFRVVCVGGSVVFDTRVDMKDAWVTRLQGKLRELYPEKTIEVVNAGIPGTTTVHSLLNVALRVLSLSPDVVIILHGVNDQKPNRYPGFRPDYSHFYKKPEVKPFRQLMGKVSDESLFASHIRYRLENILNPWRQENACGEKMERYDTVTQPGLDTYRRNMRSIIGICEKHNVDVVIATAPHSLEENEDWNPSMGTRNPLVYYHVGLTLKGIKNGFQEYNRINREVAVEGNCSLVDLEKLMPLGKELFKDDVHFTEKGADLVADLFIKNVNWGRWLESRKVEQK